MRHIHLEEGLRIRFPARSDEFALGVEVGAVAAAMALATRDFGRRIAFANLEQIRDLAAGFGYRLTVDAVDETWCDVSFMTGRLRPALTLVHSREKEAQSASPAAPLGYSAPARVTGAPKRADLRQV